MTRGEIISFYVMTSLLFLIIKSSADDIISEFILEGGLAKYLVKPINIWGVVIIRDIAKRLAKFTLGIPVFVLLINLTGTQIDVNILFFVKVILAYILTFLVASSVGLLGFWLEETWGLQNFYDVSARFLGGGVLPYSFFPIIFKNVLVFTPFFYMLSWPLNRQFIISEFMICLSLIAAMLLLVYFMWKNGIKRYNALGVY